MRQRRRVAEADRRAEESETARLAAVAELTTALAEIEVKDKRIGALQDEVEAARRRLVCMVLLGREEPVVQAALRKADQATSTLQAVHTSA